MKKIKKMQFIKDQDKNIDIVFIKNHQHEDKQARKELAKNFIIMDGLLTKTFYLLLDTGHTFMKSIIYIPNHLIYFFLKKIHNRQHFNSGKMTHSLMKQFYFPTMQKRIKLFCDSCKFCKYNKGKNTLRNRG